VVFFLVLSYSHEAYLDYGGAHFRPFPRRCPRDSGALQAFLCPNDDRTKEKTKVIKNEKRPHSHTSSADAMKAGMGRNNGSSTSAPSSSASALLSSRSPRSRSSHSDTSPRASSSAAGGTRLPTSVVEEVKYRPAAASLVRL